MDIIADLQQELISLIKADCPNDLPESLIAKITLELPKNKEHGCLSTNAAMILAKSFAQKPIILAEKLKSIFNNYIPNIAEINIAGPGFINFRMKPVFWQDTLQKIYHNKQFGQINLGNAQKVNLEFGSPNPTGPLHVGHSRGAIFGDVLANILNFANYDVTRENYINDAGSQIDTLAKSLYLRYEEIATKQAVEIPAGLYPGEYLIDIAKKIFQAKGNEYLNIPKSESLEIFKKIAINEMLLLIKSGFKDLHITHDVHFSEKSLHEDNQINQAIDLLTKQNKTYYGSLPRPKGKEIEDWEETTQLLFKATEFGDDIDRALQKSDKSWTYFAADTAYHFNKIKRGYNKMILILGADHGGYIKRMKAMVTALSDNHATIDIKLCQIVKFIKNNEIMKMSKRDGSFLTASEVAKAVGSDSLRFIMLTRKNDMTLDFDLDKAVEQSKENPIFYVQYAHARICSVLRNYEGEATNDFTNLVALNSKLELDLIRHINIFPQIIRAIATNYEPHRLAFYLQELAAKFHSYWNFGKDNPEHKFITANKSTTRARIILLETIKNTLNTGLKLFSINALEKM